MKRVVKKPNVIVLDLCGPICTSDFLGDSEVMKKFMLINMNQFVEEFWHKRQMRLTMNFLRLEESDKNLVNPEAPKLVRKDIPDDIQRDSAIKLLRWLIENNPQSPALAFFQLHIREWGYDNDMIIAHIYEDVERVLKSWNEQNIDVYVAIGSGEFLKKILSNTNRGSIVHLIRGALNLMDYNGKTAEKDFSKLSKLVKEDPSKILYITKNKDDSNAARKCKIRSLVILRSDFIKRSTSPHDKRDTQNPGFTTGLGGSPGSGLKTRGSTCGSSDSVMEVGRLGSNIQDMRVDSNLLLDIQSFTSQMELKVDKKDKKSSIYINSLDDLKF